eukprot:1310969-Ditylum_brightwellii.AAC.2
MSLGNGMKADESVVRIDDEIGLNSMCLNMWQFFLSLDLVAAFLFTKNKFTILENRDGMFSTVWLFIADAKDPCILSEGSWKMFMK